ncbi:hypothetical protein GGF43_003691 [Coemansia sp. RSA 2618]|nr:hypothetical protein GGF43_003691 [Coemansia sp. RSA 2618]
MRALCRVPEALAAGSLEAVADQLSQRSLDVSCDYSAWKHRVCDYFATVYGPRLADEDADPAALAARMKRENPNFVLRNWVAEDVIACAEKGDEAWVDKVLSLLTTRAFDDHAPPGMEDAEKYTDPVSDWREGLQCSFLA